LKKNVLQFHNVSFTYANDRNAVIQNLSFSAEQGEFISIIGPSGCGKSTLFRLLTGLEQATEGEIMIDEMSVKNNHGAVGYMPQQDLLLPWRTIVENAAISLECQGVKKKYAHEKVKEYLDKFGLKGYEEKYPRDLSGGMRQRVSFLRTFLTGADVLLLDEPFSALDAITKVRMQEWLYEQWRKWNKTIVFITHDVEEALFLSNRILVVTEKPIQKLQEFQVPLPRERTRHNLSNPEILQLKEQLIELLKEKVMI
jgi:putative hydroxymethylpyrimidine transport system ATP-binding protein